MAIVEQWLGLGGHGDMMALSSGARLRAGLGQPGQEKAPEGETLEQLQCLKGLQETWRGALDKGL